MREPYIELGISIVGQAIRDWRLESKAINYNEEESVYLKKIARFLNGDLASLCMSFVDVDPKIILENLRKENEAKRKGVST